MEWTTIESDPGVFSELIENIGVKNTGVEEIWSLDMVDDKLKEATYGLIYLFKWRADTEERTIVDCPEGLFFAKQVVQNACATQAILSILMNSEDIARKGELGEALSDFKAFSTEGLDSESLGLAIGSHDLIRNAHNAFARPDPFVMDPEEKKNLLDKGGDAYHFVAYVPFQGMVYELDGLKPGPILLGDAGGHWWDVAKPAIESRMARYEDITSCLLSVCRSKIVRLEEQISAHMTSGGEGAAAALQAELDEERRRKAMQAEENVRRRHNFTPFVVSLFTALAKKNALKPMVGAACERRTANAAAAAKR